MVKHMISDTGQMRLTEVYYSQGRTSCAMQGHMGIAHRNRMNNEGLRGTGFAVSGGRVLPGSCGRM